MSGGYRAPDGTRLKAVLAMVAGADIEIAAVEGADVAASHHGRYVDPDGAVVASCELDIAAAAALGCALSLIPVGACEDMVADGELSASAVTNLHEVFNLLSTLMVDDSTPHLRLDGTGAGPAAALPDTRGTAFDARMGAYGKGRIGFAVR